MKAKSGIHIYHNNVVVVNQKTFLDSPYLFRFQVYGDGYAPEEKSSIPLLHSHRLWSGKNVFPVWDMYNLFIMSSINVIL